MEMQAMTSGMTAHKIMEVITAVGLAMQVRSECKAKILPLL